MALLPLRLAAALSLGVAALMTPAAPVAAQEGVAGAYLAARQAAISNDYAAAARYFTQALLRDPSNPALLEGAVVAQLGLSNLDAAVPIARRLRQVAPGSQIAELALLADQLVREDYTAVLDDFAAGRQTGPLVDALVQAWSRFGKGDVSEALADFDTLAGNPALAPFAYYHKALALAAVGDFEGAEELFAGEGEANFALTRRGALARIEILGQLERFDDALALLDEAFGADPDPKVAALRDGIAARQMPPYDIVTSAGDGLGEVFFTVAGALDGETEDSYVLIYARIAEMLAPRNTDAILLTAAILERQGQYDLAGEAYNRIPRDDPAFHMAELGRAEVLDRAGRSEAALEVLQQLARSHGQIPDVHRALGDAYRQAERYADAILAYDAAIAAVPVEDPTHWILYYARAISYERTGDWPKAEADFRKALELEPDQPQVLNYLGYSFLEMHTNLDEALSMIERAVAARPTDGYIVDSLAWALFRLGRYEEAVEPMERASKLMPTDPVVTDHLGDVYWAVGRKLEARFQWRRALSYYEAGKTEDFDPERVRRKIDTGLDAVLVQEGHAPITVADDGG